MQLVRSLSFEVGYLRTHPPSSTVETPEQLQRDALLTETFMQRAYQKYTAPQLVALGGEAKPFAIKQLNVMDPILPNNNLGRSVSKASYLRIRRAFEHGARMLADIAEQAKVGSVRRRGELGKVGAFDVRCSRLAGGG